MDWMNFFKEGLFDDRKRQYLAAGAFAVVLLVNWLANALPLNGQNTGEVSARFNTYFTPAPYVFSIWGLIYLLLLGYVIYQALPRQAANPYLRKTGGLFIVTCFFNVSWIFAWHYNQFGLSLFIMLCLLASLLLLYMGLDFQGKEAAGLERWLVNLPFSIYVGWISVATIANTSVFLYARQWGGWGISYPTWTAIMLLVGTVLAVTVTHVRKDHTYGLVFVWAFIGVGVRNTELFMLRYLAWLLALILAAYLAWHFLKERDLELRNPVIKKRPA